MIKIIEKINTLSLRRQKSKKSVQNCLDLNCRKHFQGKLFQSVVYYLNMYKLGFKKWLSLVQYTKHYKFSLDTAQFYFQHNRLIVSGVSVHFKLDFAFPMLGRT